MSKKPGLSGIAPPSRDKKPVTPKLETTHAEAKKPLNVRISEDRHQYIRMLSAKEGTPQQDLIERAIDLLRKEAGEI